LSAPADTTVDSIFRISDLSHLLEKYLEPDQVREVYRAYLFGAEAHDGQQRMSGEPYITHPIEVARILATMHMDAQSIIAAILHDVIEDTPTAKEHLAEQFGEEIAELVDGVSKITKLDVSTHAEAHAENQRKMILAMVRDIRVILIKLADRLHNMRTLGVMPPEKRRRIAHETLEIYAPIAARLGINAIRIELEDLGFEALHPTRYRVLRESLVGARGNRKEIVQQIETALRRRLRQEQLVGEVEGREKHLYSIYKKMKDKTLLFNEIQDTYAFRIIVDKVDTCYRVLGAIHNLYKPVPGCFKDYIAIPKTNGYQSLHTILFGMYGVTVEVQIRTEDMNEVAENGIAAHWVYKSDGKSDAATTIDKRARRWLRSLLELQRTAGDSLEFIENVKIDLYPDEIYVFTPRGEIMELPRGATAVDFAYAVHTDVGSACVAARINRRLAPLRSPLYNGQTVEIITAASAKPNPAWLNFVISAKARTNIRSYLKNLHKEEAADLGKRLLDQALQALSTSLSDISEKQMQAVLREYQLEQAEQLFVDVGMGALMAQLVARTMAPIEAELEEDKRLQSQSQPLVIRGTEGMVVNYAKCCHPIPGDSILGFISKGRGIVIHRESCRNVADFSNTPDKWLEVEWLQELEGIFSAEIRVDVANQRGVLATLAALISDQDSNIENVNVEERDGMASTITFLLSVHNREHLARIMRQAKAVRNVIKISRTKS